MTIPINRYDNNLSGIETINEWSDGKKYTQKTLNHTFTDQFNHVIVYRYGDRESYLPTSQETINEIESVGLSDISELELSDNDLENITISKSVKEESPNKSSDVLADDDKILLEDLLTDIGIIKRAVNKMNESSNISLTLAMNIVQFNHKWKGGGKFNNDTLKYRLLNLIDTLNDFSACFRKSYNGHQKERADVLARLKYLLNSDFFQSDDAVIILPTINH